MNFILTCPCTKAGPLQALVFVLLDREYLRPWGKQLLASQGFGTSYATCLWHLSQLLLCLWILTQRRGRPRDRELGADQSLSGKNLSSVWRKYFFELLQGS